MDAIQKLLDFMEKRIDKVRSLITVKLPERGAPRWIPHLLIRAGLKLQRGIDSGAQPVD